MKILLSDLKKQAESNPNVWHDMMSHATTDGIWVYTGNGITIKQKPWPVWTKVFRLFAKPEDKGLGDIIARLTGPIGGDTYKVWYQKMFGKPCGCQDRQEKMNTSFPL